MNNALENQVAIITGSTGIAVATAHALANAEAKPVIIGRSAENLEQLQKEIPNLPPMAMDLVIPGAAKEVVARSSILDGWMF
jgi:NADP-dependent 3-hydroxy acid dehydrogenase YdfG